MGERDLELAKFFPKSDLKAFIAAFNLQVPRFSYVGKIIYNGSPTIRWDTADRCAIELGFHPTNIWPNYNDDLRQPGTPPKLCIDCDKETRASDRCDTCYRRHRYQTDPEYRERRRATVRRYRRKVAA